MLEGSGLAVLPDLEEHAAETTLQQAGLCYCCRAGRGGTGRAPVMSTTAPLNCCLME